MSYKTMGRQTHGGKGDSDTRVDQKKYHDNLGKVKKVRETDKIGFVLRVNGKVVE